MTMGPLVQRLYLSDEVLFVLFGTPFEKLNSNKKLGKNQFILGENNLGQFDDLSRVIS